jgi:hypothetical protein
MLGDLLASAGVCSNENIEGDAATLDGTPFVAANSAAPATINRNPALLKVTRTTPRASVVPAYFTLRDGNPTAPITTPVNTRPYSNEEID